VLAEEQIVYIQNQIVINFTSLAENIHIFLLW